MKNHNENDVVDEASRESFPASDAPSWFAGPGPGEAESTKKSLAGARRSVFQTIENNPDILLWCAAGSAGTAAALLFFRKKIAGYTVGGFTPLLLLVYAGMRRGRARRPVH